MVNDVHFKEAVGGIDFLQLKTDCTTGGGDVTSSRSPDGAVSKRPRPEKQGDKNFTAEMLLKS